MDNTLQAITVQVASQLAYASEVVVSRPADGGDVRIHGEVSVHNPGYILDIFIWQ